MLDPKLFVSRRLSRSRAVLEGDLRHMQGVDAWGVEATRLARGARDFFRREAGAAHQRAGPVRVLLGAAHPGSCGREVLEHPLAQGCHDGSLRESEYLSHGTAD